MAARLLSIAHSLESSELACVLQSLDGQICWDRKTWDNFEPEALLQSEAQLILAHAVPKTEETASFFQWLRRRRLPIPTVAVLPESVDRELLAIVSEAADDFILWPMQSRELALRIAKLLPSKPSVQLRNPLRDPTGLPHVVGQHPLFLQALEQVPLCASSQAPMLITGETGTGKEVFARSIHSSSTRQGGPFIPVDCAGLPEHLIESELFGHCRGAFTDASTSRKGLVAMAEGGTLFLDEVDTLSLVSQSKLLRLLEEGTYRSLGSDRFVRSSARIIAATNQPVEDIVRRRQFRSDLYFRISALRLHLTPLRERPTDVPILARHFLQTKCGRNTIQKTLSLAALRRLESHHWPGNVRELLNTIRRAFLFCQGPEILANHIAFYIDIADQQQTIVPSDSFQTAKRLAIDTFERAYVEQLLVRCEGNITRAAREAGKERRDFGRLVKKIRGRPDILGTPLRA